MRGLDFAINDIGLAIFTTLAPAATVAYIVLALLTLDGRLLARERHCLESWLIFPLALATIGLIASATHLGTPSNALYVFVNVGTSPLSTEVFCAVVFLGTACSYWLAGIYFDRMRILRVLWIGASIASAFIFLWGTTQAYGFPTVITWDTTFARINLPLVGVAGSAPLILLVLSTCGLTNKRMLIRIVLGLSVLATAVSTFSMALQYHALESLRNAYGTASSLAPFYPLAIAVFCALAWTACAVAFRAVQRYWRTGETPTFEKDTPAETKTLRWLTVATVLMYLGIFGVRFSFYRFHMTAGVV